MKKLILLAIIGLFIQLASAQQIEMVKDINPNGSSFPAHIKACHFHAGMMIATKVFFTADDGVNGYQLWVSDGTQQGTLKLATINPSGSMSYYFNSVGLFSKVVFVVNDGTNGEELWVTNGTTAGTLLLKDINPGTQSSSIQGMQKLGNRLLFSAKTAALGSELWITDGSASGTVMVKDINLGSGGSNLSWNKVEYNGKLYFAAKNSVTGVEMWCSDGTADGTYLIKDINPGAENGMYVDNLQIQYFFGAVYNDKLYFTANDGINGHELWVTDGTAANTMMVKNIHPSSSSHPRNFLVFNNLLYFTADDGVHGREIWKTNGTTAGTQKVTDFFGSPAYFSGFKVFNDKFVFFASDGVHGEEPWISNGTASGTQMIKDINPSGSSVNINSSYFHEFFGSLYFSATTPDGGHELYKTDGTESGTIKLAPPIAPNFNPLEVPQFTTLFNKLIFSANFTSHGQELWMLTESGTFVPLSGSGETVKLFPNPAVDKVQISLGVPDRIEIYNVSGELIVAVDVQSTAEIETTHWPSGIYLVVAPRNEYVGKLIKP